MSVCIVGHVDTHMFKVCCSNTCSVLILAIALLMVERTWIVCCERHNVYIVILLCNHPSMMNSVKLLGVLCLCTCIVKIKMLSLSHTHTHTHTRRYAQYIDSHTLAAELLVAFARVVRHAPSCRGADTVHRRCVSLQSQAPASSPLMWASLTAVSPLCR